MGKLLNAEGNADLSAVDPRLVAILTEAAKNVPFDVRITDGGRSGGKGNHKHGYAMDVELVDPKSGRALPNKMYFSDKDKERGRIPKGYNVKDTIPGAERAFAAYESLAQSARTVQKASYPELSNTFRWGGGFKGGGTPFDMMHFDITPKMKGAMAYYDWETGAKPAAKARAAGITSYGPKATEGRVMNAVYGGVFGGGPLPPGGMASDPGFPMIRPASLSIPSRVPTLPRQRPTAANALSAKLGATGGATNPLASLATSHLGWENGDQSWNGREVRAIIPSADNARARLTASLPGAGGDPRLSQLSVPQVPRRVDPVGAGPLSFGALQGLASDPANRTQVASLDPAAGLPRPRPQLPPVPMPGRPSGMMGAAQAAGGAAPVPMPGRPTALTASAQPPVMPMQRPVARAQPPALPPAVRRPVPATPAVNAIQAQVPQQGGGFNPFGSIMGGLNTLKDQAGGLIGNAYNAVQSTGANVGNQFMQAAPAMFMNSPKLRGAIIDPMVARMFTDKPMNRSPTRYGNTVAERQQSAANRELLSQGRAIPSLPPRSAVATQLAVSRQSDEEKKKKAGYGAKGYSAGGQSLLDQFT